MWGICLYPVLDRPDWDHLTPWHKSGLWDADLSTTPPGRILHEPYAQALLRAQADITAAMPVAEQVLI